MRQFKFHTLFLLILTKLNSLHYHARSYKKEAFNYWQCNSWKHSCIEMGVLAFRTTWQHLDIIFLYLRWIFFYKYLNMVIGAAFDRRRWQLFLKEITFFFLSGYKVCCRSNFCEVEFTPEIKFYYFLNM